MINNLLKVGYSSNSTSPFVTRGRISPFVETRTARLSLNLTSSIHRDCDFYHPNCSKISNEFWGLVLAIWFPIDRLAFLYCNEAWVTRHNITQPIRCLQLSWFQVQFEATGFWYPKSLFVSLLLGPWTQLIINWVMLWTVGYDTFTPILESRFLLNILRSMYGSTGPTNFYVSSFMNHSPRNGRICAYV